MGATVQSTPPAQTADGEAALLSSQADAHAVHLEMPEATLPVRLDWRYLISLTTLHLLALLAFLPYFFSWAGVITFIVAHHVIGSIGICVGYHRLLTHRGFTCPRWLERGLALLGVCSLQDTPARWVAVHRMHHRYSDDRPDPHSPFVNFLWGHCGWLVVKSRDHMDIKSYERYARDVLRDRFYLKLERNFCWLWIYIAHAALFYLAGFLVGWLMSNDVMAGVQLGSSVLVWGVFVRTVEVWHATWAVNSAAHRWGYRNYETSDHSRNNWFVAIFSGGEGWHNNHHADQISARHGHRWWEYDFSWMVIRTLEMVGLAKNVKHPHKRIKEKLADAKLAKD
jgi:fatty-acid desaturase